ncbi:beta-ketoacyl synthase N-terminal-like domain-containing protein [Plantactinospora sp. GCM10030261]|uniref:beta-ketoacyl synthase N-terminal-like domain-containing protein n=1 Tax=Plantactinospora sp. GCM10030261 TaxID=3273420 RepID=UPI003614FAAD
MTPDGTVLAVGGLGLRMPGVTAPADLIRQLTGEVPVPGAGRSLTAANTDLPPVDRWVPASVEPRLPPGLPARGLRNWPHESLLALAAAAEAAEAGAEAAEAEAEAEAVQQAPDATAVLWASSTAGLPEYAGVCLDAALLDPGLTSPILAPLAAYNGPASTVSIRLGLTGPVETLVGGVTAGMAAVIEAGHLLAAGEASCALVGGSAVTSRWSLAGVSDGLAPAEGSACLALAPGVAGAVTLRRSRRVGFDPVHGLDGVRELVHAAGPVAGVVLASPDPAVADALTELAGSVWHIERELGDFGAAGGFLAVVCAATLCAAGQPAVLALAVEPAGTASCMEVWS